MGVAAANPETSGVPRLRRVLSLGDLILYGIVAVTPSAPVTVFGLASVRARGHTVDTILFAMVAMALTAISYGRMASLYPAAGSAYTYVGRGLNPHLGFLAGWAMLLDYLINPLFCVVYCSLIVLRILPHIPYVIVSACLAGGMTYLNVRGIRATGRTNQLLMVVMAILLLAFIALAARFLFLHEGWGGLFSMAPFYDPHEFDFRAVLHATSFAALTYIGFDAVTTLAEDAHNPKRNVLMAIVIVVLFTGIFGGLLTYLAQRVWPDFRNFPDVATAFMDATRRVGGTWLFDATVVLVALADFGAGLATQVGAARLLFGMGRDNVLPKRFFGYLDPGSNTPTFNILLIGALSFAGSLGKRYDLIAELLNFGAFLGFMGVNAATIRQFYFLPQTGRTRSFFLDLLVPSLAFVICLVIWLGLGRLAKIVGGVWFAVGFAYVAVRTRGFQLEPVMIDFKES
ncbi:MAG: APC family permease [Acidobacteriia bacterium]|nr:APC family permease [Terriglobia bacterium]